MTQSNSIAAIADEVTAYRREMHQNPQTGYEEEFASGLVREKLTEWGIPFEDKIAVTGIVATIEGQSNTSGKAIGLRADMDALDILEENNKDHVSKIPGKMHGCGHDGHTAMLLGAAKYLNETKNFDGKVHLIFQPAEEGLKGAHKIMEEGLFERFPCDQVFGVHNWPQLPRGTASCVTGPVMASSDYFEITVKGAGGHAAIPHKAIDPVIMGAQIVTALQTLVSRYKSPVQPVVLSITCFNTETTAKNVIDDNVKLAGTLRTYDETLRQELSKRIEEVARGIAQSFGGDIDYNFEFILDATINEESSTKFCENVLKDILGEDNVETDTEPSMGGEDFGAMLMERPGCYIWLGQGEPDEPDSNHNQGLHTARYDFNDGIISTGIEYWAKIVEGALPLKNH